MKRSTPHRSFLLLGLALAAGLAAAWAGRGAAETRMVGTPLGDAERGAELWFSECADCHQIGPEAKNDIGPELNGIFGRRAAEQEGFDYSPSARRMGADGLTWTFRTLNAFVENPHILISGTRMSYDGLPDEEARADLLAYLRAYSDKPQNIPEAEPTARRVEVELSPEVLAINGSRDYGEYLASECVTCHQRGGADDGIPSITNWPEERFVVALHAYRQGLRPHQAMQMVTRRLGDEEIAALAAYFATINE